jgi:hypothetical protein
MSHLTFLQKYPAWHLHSLYKVEHKVALNSLYGAKEWETNEWRKNCIFYTKNLFTNYWEVSRDLAFNSVPGPHLSLPFGIPISYNSFPFFPTTYPPFLSQPFVTLSLAHRSFPSGFIHLCPLLNQFLIVPPTLLAYINSVFPYHSYSFSQSSSFPCNVLATLLPTVVFPARALLLFLYFNP